MRKYKVNLIMSDECTVVADTPKEAEKNGDVVAYDYADGDDMYVFSYNYDEFVKKSEGLIENYINKNDDKYSYSLIEKANKPLLMF